MHVMTLLLIAVLAALAALVCLAFHQREKAANRCHWCKEPLGDTQVDGFCSEECHDEHIESNLY